MKRELRFFETELEIRTSDEDNTITVAGMAVPYGQASNIDDILVEEFRSGVFGDTVKGENIALQLQHNNLAGPFARTGSKTLTLTDKKDGLYFRAKLDTRDPAVQSLAVQLERRDIHGVSPGFARARSNWKNLPDGKLHREIYEARLFEISLTHNPCLLYTSPSPRDS